MGLYSGFGLHSSNIYMGIKGGGGKRVMQRKVENDPEIILQRLDPYKRDIA